MTVSQWCRHYATRSNYFWTFRKFRLTDRAPALILHRMKRKTHFDCGHTGHGQYCHHCRNEDNIRSAKQTSRRAWLDRCSSTPVTLEHLPRRIAEKALRVLTELQEKTSYLKFYGKRLTTMGTREVVSIPLGNRFRLVCSEREGMLIPIEVISHETYNGRLQSNRWR